MIPQAVGAGGGITPAEAVAKGVEADPEFGVYAEGAADAGSDAGGAMKRSRSFSQFTVPSFVFPGTIASRNFLGNTSH